MINYNTPGRPHGYTTRGRRAGERNREGNHTQPHSVRLPEESEGACRRCGAFALLGNGLCVRCYDHSITPYGGEK